MGVDDVDRWAASKYHTYVTREALKENEMDGSALIDLKKVEQKSELGNASLAERKCLWGYIVKRLMCITRKGTKGVMNMLLA
mmetsp:Transcript_10744/g.19465  ORF Transcript_10744/g.19465 Transcript_10744/m.19465 type:complete len:82 (+) Transcript_10744:1181-1426(+)